MLIIGHRGAKGLAPENTLKSFKKALDLKAPMVELDLRKTKDDKIVVIHDSTINRVSNGKGRVKKFSLSQLRKFDFGEGEKIPTLADILKLLKGKCKINLEIKSESLEIDLLKLIKKYQIEKDVIITSPNSAYLNKVKELNKKIPIGTVNSWPGKKLIEAAKKLKISWLSVNYKRLRKKTVKLAHQNNIKVYAWTVNDPEDFKRMKKIRVDGIFTDYPDRFLKNI